MNSNPSDKACTVPGPISPTDWGAARDAAIDDFLSRFATDCPDRDVLADLMVAITRLARDGADRGDLKLLTSSFKELRYAFKVFAPYQGIRKVSIFGSSRTPSSDPDFLQAVDFARRMRERHWMIITGAGDGIMGAGPGDDHPVALAHAPGEIDGLEEVGVAGGGAARAEDRDLADALVRR